MLMIFCIYLCWCLRASQIFSQGLWNQQLHFLSARDRSMPTYIPISGTQMSKHYGVFLEHFTSWRELCYLKHCFPLSAAARALHLCLTEPRFSRQVETELLFAAHREYSSREGSSPLTFWIHIPNICIHRKPTGSPLDFKYWILLVLWSAGKGKVVARRYCWNL